MEQVNALRSVALRLIVFLLPVVAWCAAKEAQLRRAPLPMQKLHTRLETDRENIDLLVTGQSTEASEVDAGWLSPHGVNCAFNLQSPYYQCAMLDRQAPRLPRLREVIIGLNYHGIEQVEEPSFKWFQGAMYVNFGIPREDRTPPFLLTGDYSLLALYHHNAETVLAGAKEQHPLGWQQEAFTTASVEDMARGNLGQMDPRVFPRTREQYAGTVGRLKARGVHVDFIIAPASPLYRSFIPPDVVRRTDAELRELARVCGVPLHDYFRDPRFRMPDSADGYHLNEAGAHRFNTYLRDEVLHGGEPRLASAGQP